MITRLNRMLTQAELKSKLHYNPETGIFTRLIATSPTVKIGDIAGCSQGQGYIQIMVNNKKYLAHRLAFLYMNGSFPIEFTDHINGIRNDNRWFNLRMATNVENLRNVGIRKSNKSGHKGVSFHRLAGKYKAEARFDRKKIYLGLYETAEEASMVYEAFTKENYGEFYFNKNSRALAEMRGVN